MVIINSPSNPSGAVLDREDFERIFKLTSSRGIYLMTDECYCQFVYDGSPYSIASMPGAKETVLVAGSLSNRRRSSRSNSAGLRSRARTTYVIPKRSSYV